MMRGSRLRFDFRTTKLAEEFSNLISRNPTYDHVAIDMSSLSGAAGRFTRDYLGADRDNETVKYLNKSLFNSVLRRVSAKKSIALLFDGSEPLWKVRRTRKYPGKKFDGRFYRSAASPAMYMVEEKLRKGLTEMRNAPTELLISGPAVIGPVEAKLSGWMLDLAARQDVSRNDTIAIVGGSQDLHINALGATPFHNVSVLQFNQEWKSLTLTDSLEWLGVQGLVTEDDHGTLSKVRTDVVFLDLMANGISATDLPSLGVSFKELMEVYVTDNLPNRDFLFSESGNAMDLNVVLLEKLVSKASNRTQPPRSTASAAAYMEIILQSHLMVCGGGIRNYGFVPNDQLVEKPPPVRPNELIGHLRAIAGKNGKLRASEDFEAGMTAAEYLLVTAPNASLVNQIIPAYTGGHPLPAETVDEIVAEMDVTKAAALARETLAMGDKDAHHAMDHQASFCFVKTPGEQGPPPMWKYHPVNVGVRSLDAETRRKFTDGESTEAAVMSDRSAKNSMFAFDAKTNAWAAVPCAELPKAGGSCSELKVVTWNKQFNRHSGERTPLGRPGIDWCTSTRHVALSAILEESDADIIAMQEVEAPWWEFLAKQKWVQENYLLTCGDKADAINPWGVLMLVRKTLDVTSMANVNIAGYTGHTSLMPQVTLNVKPNVPVTVGSFHLLAPYSQNNVNNRTGQIDNLLKRLSVKEVGSHCIAAGDFNDYPAAFFTMPENLEMGDAWVEVKGETNDESGYTINGNVSKYTSLIIEPEYYGRADRIFYRSAALRPKEARLLGTVSVKEQFADRPEALKGLLVPEYLFPSDHFGCEVTFSVE